MIGKRAWFWLEGHRSGEIRRVECGARSGLRSITVRLPNGVTKRLEPRAFRGPLSGVMHRRECRSLESLGGALRRSAARRGERTRPGRGGEDGALAGEPPVARDGAGFTLIELLVCVAIVALLLAVLLPGLAGARREGKASACRSNLHQIVVGLHSGQYTSADAETTVEDPWPVCPSDPQGGGYALLQDLHCPLLDVRTCWSRAPLVSDCEAWHGGRMHVAYADGSVRGVRP